VIAPFVDHLHNFIYIIAHKIIGLLEQFCSVNKTDPRILGPCDFYKCGGWGGGGKV
jgi:hypothetical protein